ncbi:MAG TPA: threonine/serine dehydratase [Acidimicrobiales bacterium]|nr:threonine/serine dehydratase [Acidimicrobiales bacterium]
MTRDGGLLTVDEVRRAAVVLDGVAVRTPVLRSDALDAAVGAEVFLKAENMQRAGAFKFRGAYNTLASLTETERAAGVCTVSSGNHAQALALAGQLLGVRVTVVMPNDAPEVKVEATKAYGATVVTFDRFTETRDDAVRPFVDGGMTFVSSHDDRRISAGAGTAALELFDEVSDLDVLVAPIGGGGGMAGYATVAKALRPNASVVGAEPAASAVNKRSRAEGRRIEIAPPHTIADGQRLTTPGAFPFDVMRERVDEVVLVPDAEIVDAMRFLLERLGTTAEPSGAIATAAVLAGRVPVPGKRVGVIVSGGNIEPGNLARMLANGPPQSP